MTSDGHLSPADAEFAGASFLPNAVAGDSPVSSFVPAHSRNEGMHEAATPQGIVRTTLTGSTSKQHWQHEVDGAFIDFAVDQSARIEAAYQAGAWMMRLKNAKGVHTTTAKPREIYFVDMILYDPSTKKTMGIRRVPEMKRSQLFSRWVLGLLTSFMHGEDMWWKPRSKEIFDELRFGEKQEKRAEEKAAESYRVDTLGYKIVTSWWFNSFSMLMILLNSIYIWIDSDYNHGSTILDTSSIFILLDNCFLIWFMAEAVIRLRAFRYWRSAIKDPWFALDLLLVGLMMFETWMLQLIVYAIAGAMDDSASTNHLNHFSILRGIRLLRLARVARIFKIFPQLFVLVKGMVLAMKSLFYTMMLLFVLTFVFAVVFNNFSDINPELKDLGYSSVGGGFWNLLIYGTFLDSVGEMLNSLKKIHMAYAIFMIVYIFISNLTMLNMLIGVLCDVISRVTSEEEENIHNQDLERSVMEILDCYDLDNDHSLTRDEFRELMDNPDFRLILDKFCIDHTALARYETVLFQQKVEGGKVVYSNLKFSKLLEKVNQLRGGNSATVTDMVDLRNWLKRRFNLLEGLDINTSMAGRIEEQAAGGGRCTPQHEVGVQPRLGLEVVSEKTGSNSGGLMGTIGVEGKPALNFQDAVLAKLEQIRQDYAEVKAELASIKETQKSHS